MRGAAKPHLGFRKVSRLKVKAYHSFFGDVLKRLLVNLTLIVALGLFTGVGVGGVLYFVGWVLKICGLAT